MDSKQYFYEFGKILYRIDGFYAEYAKESGIKENLLWVLYALNDGKEHSQKEICESWDLPRTTVNTIVKELETENYVFLSQIKGEKRELSLSLTEKGKSYADNLLKELYLIENQVYKEICDFNIVDKMKSTLNKLYETKNSIKGN